MLKTENKIRLLRKELDLKLCYTKNIRQNRIFFLNKYWIFIPLTVLANYIIIRKIYLNKAKKKKLKKLISQIKSEKK